MYDIVFLALARDCARTVPSALRALERFEASGLSVHALIGENGSKDSTRELLDHRLVSVVDTSAMSAVSDRLERMALGRQIMADHAADFATDVVAVVDLDEPFLEWVEPGALVDKIRRLKDGRVFALAASSRPAYYDLLAFEDESRSFTGLEQQISRRQRNPVEYYKFFRDVIYPAQGELTTDDDIACRSAFNGLCLYLAEDYALGSYLADDGDWVCEHVIFNRKVAARTGRRMVVDGSIQLPTPLEHGRRSLPGFVLQRVKKLPQKFGIRSR